MKILPSKLINLNLSCRYFALDERQSEIKTVNARKYEILQEEDGITISRKINDIFDFMGFAFLKRVVFAQEIDKNSAVKDKFNFEVRLKPLNEIGFFFSVTIFVMVSILLMFIEFKMGLIIFAAVVFQHAMLYFLYSFGINRFSADLIFDCQFFK